MRTATFSLAVLLLSASAHAAITGTVIDENGKPIAGATVRAWAAEPSRVYRQRLLSTQPENEPLEELLELPDRPNVLPILPPLKELPPPNDEPLLLLEGLPASTPYNVPQSFTLTAYTFDGQPVIDTFYRGSVAFASMPRANVRNAWLVARVAGSRNCAPSSVFPFAATFPTADRYLSS